jgi:small subunit ribosomal protein S3
MGQKTNPVGIRLGIVQDWQSTWYAKYDYAEKLNTDLKVRKFIMKKLAQAGVGRVNIARLSESARIVVHAARPGVIIGKKGGDVESLKQEASKMMGVPVQVTIQEIKKPELNAKLVGENISQQLMKRVSFRRAMKRAIQSTMKSGAQGVKICISGRLGGAEIARSESAKEGRVPLHTLRADIDYALVEALTTYGIIGVKVWIFKGEVLGKRKEELSAADSDKSDSKPNNKSGSKKYSGFKTKSNKGSK